jgi:prolyl 4-hydroxylase
VQLNLTLQHLQPSSAPSCQSCANINFDERCPKRAKDAPPSLKPGTLNLMFERIVNTAPGNQTEETQLAAKEKKIQENGTPFYTVNVHSRPESTAAVPDDDGVIPVDAAKDRSEAPWVITFDNFVTEEECDHLIQLGYNEEYKRSKDVGKKLTDGSYDSVQSTTRTSENAWCSSKEGCRADPISKRVMERIANVTNIPTQNFEDFQMLKYEEGQFYRTHHDYIQHQKDRACGPRILTFFLYLSDVEEGGGTGLDQINGGLVVNPKKGKALLWPSVMNYDPRYDQIDV